MKNFFSPLFEPLGAIWVLMVMAMFWLAWKRQWRAMLSLLIPAVLIFLIGSTPLVEMLVSQEESRWAKNTDNQTRLRGLSLASLPAVDAVAALGGGQRISTFDPLGFAMTDAGSRVLTAMEILRLGKAKTLVLGGSWALPDQPGVVPEMFYVQTWAGTWFPHSGAITNLGVCIDTHDEAVNFGKLWRSEGWKKMVLITSALHLRRAEAVFKKQGVEVVPVAADFQVYGIPNPWPFTPFPKQRRFDLLSLYLHEKIGWWVYSWRGWI